jgi:DNA polymerase-1
MKKVLVVDGNNLAYRCKHVFALTNGIEDVSVTFGVLTTLRSEIKKSEPDSVIVCWDGGIPKFRKKLLPEYKAGRHKGQTKADRENFMRQIDILQENLPKFSIISIMEPGIEADDLIYYLTKMLIDAQITVYSNDLDLLQLVTPDGRVRVRLPNKELEICSDNFEKYVGVTLNQYLDYKVMTGDSSDNIKGIQGIGEVWAKDILGKYGSLDAALTAANSKIEWRAAKAAKTRLLASEASYVQKMRKVMQLGYDKETGIICQEIISRAILSWQPYQSKEVKKFLMSKAFVRLMDGMWVQQCLKFSAPSVAQYVECMFDRTRTYLFHKTQSSVWTISGLNIRMA